MLNNLIMYVEFILFGVILFLVIIQSIVGVGVLVLGTPVLLLLDYTIVNTIGLLLPVSITTSAFNLIITKVRNDFFFYNNERLKYFFLFCIPSIFLGIIILRQSNNYVNFSYVVSFLIIVTVLSKNKINFFLNKISKNTTKIFLMLIGVVHGMTNVGGTLLSILLININKSKMKSRNEITLFYFFLALTQFLIFIFLFDYEFVFNKFLPILFIIIIGVIIGNILINYTKNDTYREVVYFLALISSISLIMKNVF
tara:strand:- start:46 stop:807 length:762 start_codon:yes stop_codon:yes gene_type:complete